jgi:hypothetical protein
MRTIASPAGAVVFTTGTSLLTRWTGDQTLFSPARAGTGRSITTDAPAQCSQFRAGAAWAVAPRGALRKIENDRVGVEALGCPSETTRASAGAGGAAPGPM